MGSHLGHYLCTANNTQGRDARTVHLRGERTSLTNIYKAGKACSCETCFNVWGVSTVQCLVRCLNVVTYWRKKWPRSEFSWIKRLFIQNFLQMENSSIQFREILHLHISIQFLLTIETMNQQIAKKLFKALIRKEGDIHISNSFSKYIIYILISMIWNVLIFLRLQWGSSRATGSLHVRQLGIQIRIRLSSALLCQNVSVIRNFMIYVNKL